MKNWRIHSIPILGILLYGLLWKVLYPWLGYMLDSDAVGYLTVAERVSRGDYFKSINGLWSPLNSWLLLLFSHEGMNFFYRAQLWNLLFGGILLFQFWWIMRLFNVNALLQIAQQFCLSIVMVYLVYYQVFADLLQCVFLMTYLIYWQYRGVKNTLMDALLIGLLIGVGFYAKAYTWVFFVLHFGVIQAHLVYQKTQTIRKAILRWGTSILASLLVMTPWIIAIHKKYGIWSITGLAGKLNMSWYINSGKTFKPEINLLIPPPHTDSPSFWEDPYLSQADLTSPFTSLNALAHWVLRVVHSCFSAITCYTELSFLSLFIIGWSIYWFFLRSSNSKGHCNEKHLIFALLILPLGYLAMHIETRYLWLSLFLLPVLFSVWYQQLQRKIKYVVALVWLVSLLVFPLIQIEALREKNKDLFYEAAQLRKLGFTQVKFTSTAPDEGRMWVLAYLTKSMCYTIEAESFALNTLELEMKKYNVPYILIEKNACRDGFFPAENQHWSKKFETQSLLVYQFNNN